MLCGQADPEHEIEFIHATAAESDPAKWNASSFVVPEPSDPLRYALTASLLENETHIWAPHCLRDEPNKRWVMVYALKHFLVCCRSSCSHLTLERIG